MAHAAAESRTVISLSAVMVYPAWCTAGIGHRLLRLLTVRCRTGAVDRAWSYGPTRLWLHTCTEDHPAAISNYVKAGFQVYKVETK